MRQLIISPRITIRDFNSLDKYLKEVDKIDKVTAEEEVILARKIRSGDQLALEKLTKANLRFVISVAKQYQNYGITLGDLIAEGNIGLIIAAKKYDETKGFKFISFAVWWIRQSITLAIARYARMVRMPYNQLTVLSKIYKAYAELEQERCCQPSVEEIAECLQIPVPKILEISENSYRVNSIDEPLMHKEGLTLLDILSNKESSADRQVMYESIRNEILYSLNFLNSRDREILILYFGLDRSPSLSVDEIGKRFNISKEHVCRIKSKALDKLRKCSGADNLKSCFV